MKFLRYYLWLCLKNWQNANRQQRDKLIKQQKKIRGHIGYKFVNVDELQMVDDIIFEIVDKDPMDEMPF